MDKASPLFQHQIQKAALPYSIHVFSRTRARITRIHYTIIHIFCLHCLHHPQKNTSQRPNSPLRPCFSTLPFTISLHLCLHLCLHPYSPDFQPISPIGEGVKAICTHYYSVYARRSAGGYLSTGTFPFRGRPSGETKRLKC